MAKFYVGDHVWADFQGAGKVLAHVVGGPVDDDGEKWRVQDPNGSAFPLAYREPEDRDEKGSGGTFWTVD